MADIYADEFNINESEEGTSDPYLESNNRDLKVTKKRSMAPVVNKNRFEFSPSGMAVGDNFCLNPSMRNTVHGAGGFFDQRNQNLKA